MQERLQKILARAGVASRRKAEQLIVEGRVTVNGSTVTELGSRADLDADEVRFDGRLLGVPARLVYIALNKPKGYVSTARDPEGRPTVLDLVKGVRERLYPVGRLDYNSEGLILLTNDGEFSYRLLAPASHVPRTYLVKVNGPITSEQEEQFRRGLPIHGRRTAPAGLKLVRRAASPWYEVRLTEGRTNQIHLMFKHLGRLVEKLKRVRIGFLELGSLPPGGSRFLRADEVARFRKMLKLSQLE